MKREYETTFILDARLSPDKIDTKIKDIEKIIKENGGTVSNVNRIGKRRLAYEIKKNQYGYYVSYRFAIEGDKLIELRRRYSLEESIIRFLSIRIPKVVLEMETRAQEKEKDKEKNKEKNKDKEKEKIKDKEKEKDIDTDKEKEKDIDTDKEKQKEKEKEKDKTA